MTGRGRDGHARSPQHRLRRVLVAAVVVLLAGTGVFLGLWFATGAHEVSLSTADKRFRHDKGAAAGYVRPGRPAEGVYRYTGTGTNALSLPPKTQHDGPLIPGTVTYGADGCWRLHMDFSSNHYEYSTFCLKGDELLETRRGGWYRWDFVATTVGDTAAYTCGRGEVVLPGDRVRGRRFHFSCTGSNHPLKLGKVTLSGSARFAGYGSVLVAGHSVPAVHIVEVGRFSGGQTGTDYESTWYDRGDGLPLSGSWTTDVNTPTAVGTSTLDASGRYVLDSLVPHG